MLQPVSDNTRNLATLLSEMLRTRIESANKSADSEEKSANKSADSEEKSADNFGQLTKRQEEIMSLMVDGKEYSTEAIASLIGLKGPRTRQAGSYCAAVKESQLRSEADIRWLFFRS